MKILCKIHSYNTHPEETIERSTITELVTYQKLVWVRRKSLEQLAEEAEERKKAEAEREALAARLSGGI